MKIIVFFCAKILVYQKNVLYLHIQKKHSYKPIKITDMTQQEFYQRTNVIVKSYEFEAIHTVYMMSDLNKDEFCQMWCQMNSDRVAEAKARAKKEAQKDSIRKKVDPILLKIEKQNDKYNRAGEICNSAVLTEKEKNFLLKNNLVCENSFECSAGTLLFIIKTNLKCI